MKFIYILIFISCSAVFSKPYKNISDFKNSNEVFKIEQVVEVKGYYASNDGGGARYIIKNQIINGSVGVLNLKNGLFGVLVKVGKLSSKVFGIFPDGSTDWRANGKMSKFLFYCANNKIKAVFEEGVYKCSLDNTNSNIEIHFKEGSVFTETIHIAMQNKVTVNTPIVENVKATGVLTSYDRVGSYNCNNIYIEKIKLINSPNMEHKVNGIHFYYNTTNLVVDEIYVEDSWNRYGLCIDGLDQATRPNNITINKVYINNSQTNGSYIHARNVNIKNIIIKNYGEDNVVKNLKNKPYYGFKLFRSSDINIGNLEVYCKKKDSVPKDNLRIWDCENLKIQNLINIVNE